MERISTLTKELKDDNLIIDYRGTIALIGLNKPRTLNALSRDLAESLQRAFTNLQADPKVKVIILHSKIEKAFCAGADIKSFHGTSQSNLLLYDHLDILRSVFQILTKPVIACVNKLALGGGFELALNCDIIVCDKECRFGLPEIKLGLFPSLGGTLLAKMIGRHAATYYIMTGEFISADEAKKMKIVQDVEDTSVLALEKAIQIAKKIEQFSLYTLIMAKRTINTSFEESGTLARNIERTNFNALFDTVGTKEGINAFIEKKKPDFNDK